MVNFFPQNPWRMMTLLNPLDMLIPEIPFSFFFGQIMGPSHLQGLGVGLGRILGEGGLARGLFRPPPPPPVESLPTPSSINIILLRRTAHLQGIEM